jgi:hypothetical protein
LWREHAGVEIGPGVAHACKNLTRVGVDDNCGGALVTITVETLAQQVGHTSLEPGVDRDPEISRLVQQCLDLGPSRLKSMAHERNELRIISAQEYELLVATRLRDRDGRRAVVESAQSLRSIALQERCVARCPVAFCSQITQHVIGAATKRITPSRRLAACAGKGQWRAVTIQNPAPGDHVACRGHQPRVVLESVRTVRQDGEHRPCHRGIGGENLHLKGTRGHDEAAHAEYLRESSHWHAKGGTRARRRIVRNRQQDADANQADDHGRLAITEERRDDTRERDERQRSANDQEKLDDHSESDSEREEERVVALRVQRDANRSPRNDGVEDQNGRHTGESKLFPHNRKDEVCMRGRHDVRISKARANTCDTAGSKRPEAVRNLVASSKPVFPGREPDADPRPDGGWDARLVSKPERAQHECKAGKSEPDAPARDRIERQEHARHDEGGAEIFLRHIERQCRRHAEDQGKQVIERRDVQPRQEPGAPHIGILQRAEVFPAVAEVRGDERYLEQAYDFDRLTTPEVHLYAAPCRTAAKHDEHHRQRDGGEQRQVGKRPEPFVINRHCGSRSNATKEDTDRERLSQQRLP